MLPADKPLSDLLGDGEILARGDSSSSSANGGCSSEESGGSGFKRAYWHACTNVERFLKVSDGLSSKSPRVSEALVRPLNSERADWHACTNVERFLKVCRRVGLRDVSLFTSPDLVDGRDDQHLLTPMSPVIPPLFPRSSPSVPLVSLPFSPETLSVPPCPPCPPPLPVSSRCAYLSPQVCRRVGLRDVSLFTSPDLVDGRDVRRVCLCLRTLSKRLVGIRDFDGIMGGALLSPDYVDLGTQGGEGMAGASLGGPPASTTAPLFKTERKEQQQQQKQFTQATATESFDSEPPDSDALSSTNTETGVSSGRESSVQGDSATGAAAVTGAAGAAGAAGLASHGHAAESQNAPAWFGLKEDERRSMTGANPAGLPSLRVHGRPVGERVGGAMQPAAAAASAAAPAGVPTERAAVAGVAVAGSARVRGQDWRGERADAWHGGHEQRHVYHRHSQQHPHECDRARGAPHKQHHPHEGHEQQQQVHHRAAAASAAPVDVSPRFLPPDPTSLTPVLVCPPGPPEQPPQSGLAPLPHSLQRLLYLHRSPQHSLALPPQSHSRQSPQSHALGLVGEGEGEQRRRGVWDLVAAAGAVALVGGAMVLANRSNRRTREERRRRALEYERPSFTDHIAQRPHLGMGFGGVFELNFGDTPVAAAATDAPDGEGAEGIEGGMERGRAGGRDGGREGGADLAAGEEERAGLGRREARSGRWSHALGLVGEGEGEQRRRGVWDLVAAAGAVALVGGAMVLANRSNRRTREERRRGFGGVFELNFGDTPVAAAATDAPDGEGAEGIEGGMERGRAGGRDGGREGGADLAAGEEERAGLGRREARSGRWSHALGLVGEGEGEQRRRGVWDLVAAAGAVALVGGAMVLANRSNRRTREERRRGFGGVFELNFGDTPVAAAATDAPDGEGAEGIEGGMERGRAGGRDGGREGGADLAAGEEERAGLGRREARRPWFMSLGSQRNSTSTGEARSTTSTTGSSSNATSSSGGWRRGPKPLPRWQQAELVLRQQREMVIRRLHGDRRSMAEIWVGAAGRADGEKQGGQMGRSREGRWGEAGRADGEKQGGQMGRSREGSVGEVGKGQRKAGRGQEEKGGEHRGGSAA
ncbi:unnamed protein product [Closterium sp. Naga37s-1]|nr:unnamed protein product [Closterium sp. Naga37s-1]